MKVTYGPEWPDPADVPDYLAHVRQFVMGVEANGGTPEGGPRYSGAIVVLVAEDDDTFNVSWSSYGLQRPDECAALSVASAEAIAHLSTPLAAAVFPDTD